MHARQPARTGQDGEPQGLLSAGSRLCLSCGLCCRGALHTNVLLFPDEAGQARAAGLQPEHYPGHLGFHLPCTQYIEQRCAVYAARPAACRRYRCALLHAVLEGELPLAQAEAVVCRACGLFAGLEGCLPPGGALAALHQGFGRPAAGSGEGTRTEYRQERLRWLFAAAELEYTLRRYFAPGYEGETPE